MQDQLEAYRDAVDEQTLEISLLHTKVEELEHEKLSVEAKLIEMDERESDVDALMGDAKAKFEMEKAVLMAELDELKRKLKQQRMLNEQQQQVQESKTVVKDEEEEDAVRGHAGAGMEDLEKQLEMLQELRVRDKSTILELNQRILQQQSDLESLAEHLNVDVVVESAVEAALQAQKAKLESLEHENATLKRRLREQRELAQDLELRQGIVEKQLVEAEEWNAKYEQQAGLEDVVKYQKKLRAQLEQQQKMNVKLRQDLNEQVEAAGRLHVAFERLKADAGKPASFEYDDLAIADHLKGQLAINGAVMRQMEVQIQELEAERLRFLKKLRDQARLAGHKLYEQHGLTTEEWGAVEEFIDRVKQTPEVAKRLLETDCELDSIDELERKLDVRCEENAILLKDMEQLQSELEEARGELLRALDTAKTKAQRQEGVIYHLRAEIASLRKEREQKDGKKDAKLTEEVHTQSYAGTQTSPETADADNIALVVAKAIETQFALLQAQTGSLLPSKTLATPAKVSVNPASPVSRTTVDNLAFESEDQMMQQVDLMRELNVCLDELVATEARNEQLQTQLHQHEEVFQSLMDQHTVLYQHFFQMHAQYTNAEIRLRHELEQVAEEKKDYKLKCGRYEAGFHLLGVQNQQSLTLTGDLLISGNEAQLRSEVIELTRKVAAYEVNEARLKRKCHQLHSEWRSSTEHNKLLKREWSEMERTLKYRVLYLETWKQGADEMIERMEKTLEKSVLREFADSQQRTVADVLKKYNALSESYAKIHAKYLEMYDLPAQLSRTRHSLMVLQAEKSARKDARAVDCDPAVLQDRITQLESELQKQMEHNRLLYERINEVEQLYESLALECAKYKDIASLAASQANTLTKRAAQEQGNREQQEEQLRELMASSEDHAIVGELQHQLMQIKATYQQFLVQYDLVTEAQQQILLKNQRLELEMEKTAQELSATREKSSDRVQTLENAIAQVKERDWTARNTKWEAFRKRLDALESDIQVEQQRRKQLEKDLEDKRGQLPLLDVKQPGNQSEVGRLKSRVDALETRERLLMGQLEAAAKATGSKEREIRLQAELSETKALNEDLMRQVEAIQARVSELLRLNGDLEAEKRELRCKFEDLELDLQDARTGIAGGETRRHDNQRDDSSHSPLMRQKVGLYEKDQAELQQAAQVTIASLKQLVEEKNTLINEYQRKLAVVRASSAQDKAQDRLETTQLNKKLYEENQRMIGQLKEAMSTISSMERSGKSKQALQAAQERHDHVLQEWKQAEIALEGAKQSIRELQMEREVLRNERDLAEARAGEALEEIILLKEKVVECEKLRQKLEHQVAFVKRDVARKEEKLKALRDAIIKLKEEFLKAEDRHAIEIVKAQHAMNQDLSARKRKEKERREEEEDGWKEEKTRLQSQVQMLQEKYALLKKKHEQLSRRKKKVGSEEKEEKDAASEVDVQILKDEVERLKRLVKDKVVSEARAVEELEKKIRILQAQNLALREASTHAPVVPTEVDAKAKREQLESERKLQRRVDILMLRLKEKQADVTSKDSELERCNEHVANLEAELQAQQAKNEKERLAQVATAAPAVSSSVKQQLEEVERQNTFLQETLALKRKEWEDSFTTQMQRYETQLQRLRRRLVQYGIPSTDDDVDDDTKEHEPQTRLRREEQRFLVDQDVREELLALGDEMRSKEQDMVAKDTKLLDLELEIESLRLEYKRLQRNNQQRGKDGSEDTSSKQRRAAKGVAAGRGSSWANQERLELEEVIENMKKVIEKLRAENEKLKKAATKQAAISPERVDAMRRKLKEHKEARERLETQLEKLQLESGELKRDKLKLQQKLRAKASSSSSKSEHNALDLLLKEKDRLLLQSEKELAELRRRVLQLELLLERDANIEDVGQIQHGLEERVKELETQVLELEDENTKLTNELAAFDEDFFEEIEDLKYKYAQAVRDKRKLEKRLSRSAADEASPKSTSSRRSRS
ncbi:centrosome-associated protein, putative [Phytophthora infestans T30-4]|uniref:Centrosome-associated protein, putative n=1 Tax=Phytophthora infestans (strain T30-4) TaxID=403677 RepID=D0NC60_PHYIT|nr:centrosome-associated protein, putative [Phytophthora infestans T30-4]EEY55574.1 centrosome-associated protein, putative [Phytophthora infestans T30-4]|eukprot:XP_002903150.1 centrosome-associated protein, putative [Phytophthora infestans T30-4]